MSDRVRAEAVDPAASFLVQAPAGSGKTELLTRRILRLLSIVDEPEEILALTFTRKAAAEMRGRVIAALGMPRPEDESQHSFETWRLASAVNERSAARGWHLAEHPSRLRMMTLDSLTHALARQLPLLSGLGDMPTPSTHVQPLYREAAEMAVARLIRRDPEKAAAALLHQDHNLPGLIALLADMLGKREQWLTEVRRHANDPAALRDMQQQVLAAIMQQKLDHCAALMPVGARVELPLLIAFAAGNRGEEELATLSSWPPVELSELPLWQRLGRELMTGNKLRKPGGINARRGFPAGKEFAAQKQAFQGWLAQLAEVDGLEAAWAELDRLPPEACFDDAQWRVLEAQLELLLLADDALQRLFAQRGEADFTEIAMRAMRALEDEAGNPTDLLLRLDYRIRHILVDEFQDTSLLQYRLLRNLTEGWQAGDGTHRTLFMVGDPMQSIYRFRKADVGLFLLAANNRAQLPAVETKPLTRNFRSSPAIVEWVNRAFAHIFPRDDDILMAAVKHAKAESALHHEGAVQLHVQHGRDAASEAAAVLDVLREALQKPEQRIGILARSRRQLHVIMQMLGEAGIAFRAMDILPLNEQPEVRLLRALLRALLHPADRESWAALLRGPCCGLDTVALHTLIAGDERQVGEILTDTQRLVRLGEDAGLRVSHLHRALQPCLSLAGKVELRPLLLWAWERLGMPGLLPGAASRNVGAMLDLVAEMDAGGLLDFALLDERLEELYAAPDSSAEAARVELLTMHGAKGLQWDVVILPGLGQGNGRSDAPLLAFTDVPVGDGMQPLVAVKGAVRSSDAVYDLVRDVEKQREANELARLLYVACTRAETELHMFGHVSEAKGEAVKGSLLRLLMPDGMDGGCHGASLLTLQPGERSEAQGVRKLRRLKVLPSIPEVHSQLAPSESEYFWAGPEAAPIGTAVHAALQHIAERGIEQWQESDTAAEGERIRRMLLAAGLSGDSLEEALARSQAALQRVLASEKGRWLLSGSHAGAHCEWALSSMHEGMVAHHVIDRSFVDAQGVRWIVDYKTASHEGGDTEAFLVAELERHAPQLSRYAALLSELEPGQRIRSALYFPMLDAWVEASAGEGQGAA